MLRSFFEYLGRHFPIENRYVFLVASIAVVTYVAYISIARRHKPGRPGNEL